MNDEWILEYSNMIYSITHYFENYKQKDDLYQAGCVGLMMAYQNFDESYGVKFSTYAYSYILGEMKKLVREDRGIKVSRNLLKLNQQIESCRTMLCQTLMRDPTDDEISYTLGITVEELEEAKIVLQSLVHLDSPIEMEENEVTLADVVPSHQIDYDEWIAFKDEFKALSPVEKKLLVKRYMDSQSQTEVAQDLGMNQVQVSRFEKKLKEKIRERLVA